MRYGGKKWHNLKVNERHELAKVRYRRRFERKKSSFAQGWYHNQVNLLEKKNGWNSKISRLSLS